MSLSVSVVPTFAIKAMATLCAFCETLYEHFYHGIMPSNMLLLHICICAFKQNVSCTTISLTSWQQAS